jgi:hypothetical protein
VHATIDLFDVYKVLMINTLRKILVRCQKLQE